MPIVYCGLSILLIAVCILVIVSGIRKIILREQRKHRLEYLSTVPAFSGYIKQLPEEQKNQVWKQLEELGNPEEVMEYINRMPALSFRKDTRSKTFSCPEIRVDERFFVCVTGNEIIVKDVKDLLAYCSEGHNINGISNDVIWIWLADQDKILHRQYMIRPLYAPEIYDALCKYSQMERWLSGEIKELTPSGKLFGKMMEEVARADRCYQEISGEYMQCKRKQLFLKDLVCCQPDYTADLQRSGDASYGLKLCFSNGESEVIWPVGEYASENVTDSCYALYLELKKRYPHIQYKPMKGN